MAVFDDADIADMLEAAVAEGDEGKVRQWTALTLVVGADTRALIWAAAQRAATDTDQWADRRRIGYKPTFDRARFVAEVERLAAVWVAEHTHGAVA